MKISTAWPVLGSIGLSALLLTGCGASDSSSYTATSDSSSNVTTTTVRQGPPTTIVGGPVTTIPINPVTTTTIQIVNTTTTTTLKSITTTTTTLKPTTTTTTQPAVTTTTTLPSSGANPTLGAHALAYYTCGNQGTLKTAALNTAASGSTVLAWTGRGIASDINSADVPQSSIASNGAPMQLGSTNNYSPYWPDSAEALYAWTQYSGGAANTFSFPVPHSDEFSGLIIEVLNGGNIQNYNFTKVVSGANTSGTVTTTGPATLVAIWAGDSGSATSYATPNNGFTVINQLAHAESACYVEVTVATKDVSAAGTYNVTWTPNVTQGAHLWLVAIQKK